MEVEVDVAPGLPRFDVVGLPDAAVQEARERARAAVRNSGFNFPGTRIVAALAPANPRKAGPAYDLPIAVAMLIATHQAPKEADDLILLGELSDWTALCDIHPVFYRWSPPATRKGIPVSWCRKPFSTDHEA